jgi:putative FmdB family regulatory protein
MPTYQYACTSCGEQLEAVQKFSDEPLTECPACGGRLRKVFSAVGVVFKGSGFYKTDSRTTSKKSSSSNTSSDKSAGTEKSSDKSSSGESSSGESSSGQSSPDTGKPTTSSSSSGQVA